ncbi:Na/Pi symporter [candidate division WOR-3 bacterium]|nr:Na/Pi symporter [candidate division WOR-3 bacterium]
MVRSIRIKNFHPFLNLFIFIISIYFFLVSIKLMGSAMEGIGIPFIMRILGVAEHPFTGIFIGILATSIIQSSSCVTAIVVGIVGSGGMSVATAIPIVMGSNIGTTITNTIVSFGHIRRKTEFGRAFPAAIVHDLFNVLTVIILFPLEMHFHFIEKISAFFSVVFENIGGIHLFNPMKVMVSPVVKLFERFLFHNYIVILIVALIILFTALHFIVKSARKLATRRVEVNLDRYLFGRQWKSFIFGLILTAIVQSSSVTTSLVVPLVGAGVLDIERIFPYTLGANIGTTVTALLASLMTGSIVAVQTAFAHLAFNILGIIAWYPFKFVPIRMAKALGRHGSEHRYLLILYVVIIFFIIPITLILVTRR